jgi:phospholipid/cholesterol/gamma-HCH transport system ATP-binding protein
VETPLIEFRNVVKGFGDRTILQGVDLKIYRGQITTLIGKSGTGKSVLLKHIIGLLTPDSGSILFDGKPLENMTKKELNDYRSRISYMFQSNALFDSMTVFENIALPLEQTTRMRKKEIKTKVMNRINQMELHEVVHRYPSELSGGMQKRVALARALVTDPEIVLFDEPTTGQDPIRRNSILTMIAQYKKKFGFTAILISHDIPDMFFISDRIILLWDGKIAFQGTYEESTSLDHPMIDEFLASLEGFQDELTGLLSKQAFRTRYDSILRRKQKEKTFAAILFKLELDHMCEIMGSELAFQSLRSLGEYISKQMDSKGGFSARQSTEQILTILPYTGMEEAQNMLNDFAQGLNRLLVCNNQAGSTDDGEHEVCGFEINVYAGVTESKSNEEIEKIIIKARAVENIIAQYRCESRRELQREKV